MRGYTVIKKRPDFLAANRGKRYATPGFVLLVHDRRDDDPAKRLGITITKKVGNAVVRNRMRRRFRELAAELLPTLGKAGADHILIGREGGIERDFGQLRPGGAVQSRFAPAPHVEIERRFLCRPGRAKRMPSHHGG